MYKIDVVMGSKSDWETMKYAYLTLREFNIQCEPKIISAHRTPDLLFSYAKGAKDKGLRAIIAGAGGAAHLPGMLASLTTVPVLGVPIESKTLCGVDSLLSIVQMPRGIPVATFTIGQTGAMNAALFAIGMIGDPELVRELEKYRAEQTRYVLDSELSQ